MIGFITIIYIGGFAFLYTKLFYLAFYGENGNNGESSSSSSSSSSCDSDDSVNEPTTGLKWQRESKLVPTFRNKNLPHSSTEDQEVLLPSSLSKKSVRFHPVSTQHATFSRSHYKRRNQEYFDTMDRIKNEPEFLNQIRLEVYDYKKYEMDVRREIALEMNETKESDEAEDIFKFEYDDEDVKL